MAVQQARRNYIHQPPGRGDDESNEATPAFGRQRRGLQLHIRLTMVENRWSA